jgi:transposase
MKTNVIGMDIAKRIIQLHTVCAETGETGRFKLQRRDTLAFLARRVPAIVALEACGSAHWWAREISRLGHEVRLLAPKSVRPFVLRNKTDAADARAIWTVNQHGKLTRDPGKSAWKSCHPGDVQPSGVFAGATWGDSYGIHCRNQTASFCRG